MRRRVSGATAALLVVMTLASPASAQRRRRPAPEPEADVPALVAAEQAYARADFDRTLEHAAIALQEGGHTPPELVRVYLLLGVCASALGDTDGARDFFQRMLAIDPAAVLDDTVPPRLRGPYLEARGAISARPERLGVEAGIVRARSALRIAVSDPFHMTHRVRVHARLPGETAYTDVESSEGTAEVLAELPGVDVAERAEYWVELVDEYGNVLLRAGDELEPRAVGRVPGGPVAVDAGASGGGSVFDEPAFWIIAIGVVLVGGATATAIAVDQSSQLSSRVALSTGF